MERIARPKAAEQFLTYFARALGHHRREMPANDLVIRTPRARGGAPKASLTDAGHALVERLAAEGCDRRTIAKELGIGYATLQDMLQRDEGTREALARGHGTLADELTHHLLTAARKGNITAAIYLTKARLGWIEGQVPEGAPKTAVQVNIQIPRAMSDAEFRRMVGREGGSGPSPSDGGADL